MPANGLKYDESTVLCPCKDFETLPNVLSALNAEVSTRALIAWLSGTSFQGGEQVKKEPPRLSCQAPDRRYIQCPRRVATSFAILNGIRDACRPYLESPTLVSAASGSAESTNGHTTITTQPSYEESFPSLSEGISSATPSTLVARKRPKQKSLPVQQQQQQSADLLSSIMKVNYKSKLEETTTTTAKRRIRPAPVVAPTASTWGSLSSSTPGSRFRGNISILPSEDPLPLGDGKGQSSLMPTSQWPSLEKKTNRTESLARTKNAPSIAPESQASSGAKAKDVTRERARLAEVHATLILHHLVPSTAMELHLLIRLLAVMDTSNLQTQMGLQPPAFQLIFESAASCHAFAIDVLKRLVAILRNLDLDLLMPLAECPPIGQFLPDLKRELLEVAEERRRSVLLFQTHSPARITGATQPAAMITLPFDEDRDSRHNYRSREDAAIYKNREESRDAFLYQLRAFQNVRGKVLDVVQVERSIDKIRVASRDVTRTLLLVNMPWFSELFCELLMQIGLVPMEETDKDLLKIADKEKLQKLHKRFSSKSGQSNKSSKSLVLETTSKGSGAVSPVAEAQQHFPGHQEFFFIFILATDSHNLSHHLKSCLKSKLMQLSLDTSSSGVERRVSNLRLISKFLGMLVFSPNWGVRSLTSSNAVQSGIVDGPDMGIPLLDVVEGAWRGRTLTPTIPWVVEYLQMSQWHFSLQNSSCYKNLLGFLAGILFCNELDISTNSTQVNMQRLHFYIENLFGEIVGLDKIAFLSPVVLPEREPIAQLGDGTGPIDVLPVVFSRSELSTANPHVDELFALLMTLSKDQAKEAKASNAPRKLRPYYLSESAQDAPPSLLLSPETNSTNWTQTIDDPPVDPVVCGKLKDAFFHQHRDLKELCEFVVNRALKNAGAEVREQSVIPFLENALTSQGLEHVSHDVKKQAISAGKEHVRATLERTVKSSLDILCPKDVQSRVKDIAATLAIGHGVQVADTFLVALVEAESRKAELHLQRSGKKQSADAGKRQNKDLAKEMDLPSTGKIEIFVAKANELLASRDREQEYRDVTSSLRDLRLHFKENVPAYAELSPTAEDELSRSFVSLLKWCTQKPMRETKMLWPVAAEILITATSFRQLENRGHLSRLVAYLIGEEAIASLLELGLHRGLADPGYDDMSSVLIFALKGRLIAPSIFERALLKIIETAEGGKELSESFLKQLGDSQGEEAIWKDGATMQMARLRIKVLLFSPDM